MTLETVYFTSTAPTQLRIPFIDGSPCNDEGNATQIAVVAADAKRDYFFIDVNAEEDPSGFEELVNSTALPDGFETIFDDFNKAVVEPEIEFTRVDQKLIDDTKTINSIIVNNMGQIDKYPDLKERVEQNTFITTVEVADFQFQYFVPDLSNQLYLMSILNDYYQSGSFYAKNSKSFCDLISSIFDKSKFYFNMATDFLKKIEGFMNQIKNFSLKGLVDQLKKRVMNQIDAIVNKYKRYIEAFNLLFMKKPGEPNQVHPAIANKACRLKAEAEKVCACGPELKKRGENIISFIISLFEDPKIEEIQYIIERICRLLEQIESIFKNATNPMQALRESFEAVKNTTLKRQQYNTVYAIAAGGLRYSPVDVEAGVARGRATIREQGGNGADWVPPSYGEISGIPTWEEIKAGHPDIQLVGGAANNGPSSWTSCTAEARTCLMRLQRYISDALGRHVRLQITSAYRSPAYNAKVGGAKNSYHSKGMAFDCIKSAYGANNAELFIRCAYEAGFKGIGRYNSFIHVDVGPKRSWRG